MSKLSDQSRDDYDPRRQAEKTLQYVGERRAREMAGRRRAFLMLATISQSIGAVGMLVCLAMGHKALVETGEDDMLMTIAVLGFVGSLLSFLIVAALRILWRDIHDRPRQD